MKYNELISKMTLEEKASLCSGRDFWHTKSVDRLGVKAIMMSDGPHGLRQQVDAADHVGLNESIKAVCFPAASATAASFDKELLRELGEAIGDSCQAQRLAVILGPAVNIKRSPLCGRNFEYFSEDPYLTGALATEYIKGVQSKNIGVSVKHFFANNQENRRMSVSSNMDERTMREIYLAAFEAIVKDSKPWTIMCSYNRINGLYMSKNKKYLTDVLRGEWGFDGCVVTDWGAVTDRVEGIKAGLELEMPSSNGLNDKKIVEAVVKGQLDEKLLDQSVDRLLQLINRYYDNAKPDTVWDMESQHRQARRMAGECAVLLKNDGVLPLSKTAKIAFIGGFADKPRYQGGGSSHINSFKVTGALEAVKDLDNIVYAPGFPTDADVSDQALCAQALKAAQDAEYAVVFAGLPDSFESEGYDRTHLNLPECQNELIKRVAAVNKNTIVVLHNGSPVLMPWLGEVKGVIEMYMGGQAVGEAERDLLFGDVNPSGRLPETFPLKLEDTPAYLYSQEVMDECDYREGIFVGYRYYDRKNADVLFPFGFGLSYSKFEYSNLRLDKTEMDDTDEVTVRLDVENVSERAGSEVVQLYVGEVAPKRARAARELRKFAKLKDMRPGEKRTVAFKLNKRDFAYWSEDAGDWRVDGGRFAIEIGLSSRDISLSAEITVNSSEKVRRVYTEDSILIDLLNDDGARAKIEPLVDSLTAVFAPASGDDVSEAAISRDMITAMVGFMPLRGVVNMTGGLVAEDTVKALLRELNG